MTRENQMNMRQKLMDEVSKAQKMMVDLRDMLTEEGMPEAERRIIARKLNFLSDLIFYNQDTLDNCR